MKKIAFRALFFCKDFASFVPKGTMRGKKITDLETEKAPDTYSERGLNYVKTLNTIINYN